MIFSHARSISPQQCSLIYASMPGAVLLQAGSLIPRRSGHLSFHTVRLLRYQRKPEHVPNTQTDNETHYILALHTNAAHHAAMTALRKRFFPARLNKLEAHVALFRALPGSRMDVMIKDLESLTSKTMCFPIKTSDIFILSKGVAVNADDGGHSRAMYETLKKSWHTFISKQDQSYRPHYTVANKLNGEQDVQNCLEAMHTDFQGSEGMVEGLALFRYDRGWWADKKIFWLQRNKASDGGLQS